MFGELERTAYGHAVERLLRQRLAAEPARWTLAARGTVRVLVRLGLDPERI